MTTGLLSQMTRGQAPKPNGPLALQQREDHFPSRSHTIRWLFSLTLLWHEMAPC